MTELTKEPAFPTLTYNKTTGNTDGHFMGLSKREYIASKALESLILKQSTIHPKGIKSAINLFLRNFGFTNNIELDGGHDFKSACKASFMYADEFLRQSELSK